MAATKTTHTKIKENEKKKALKGFQQILKSTAKSSQNI